MPPPTCAAPGSTRLGLEVPFTVLTQVLALVARVLTSSDEGGQGLAEYALILTLIAIVAVMALMLIGQNLATTLSRVGNSV